MRTLYARYAWEVQSRALRLVAVGVALAFGGGGGCNQPRPDAPPESCEEGEERILALADEMTAEFAGPCTNDDECVIVRATGSCPVAGPFALPDEPILFGNISAASEFVDDNARSLCPPEECAFPTFDNFYVAAVCTEGKCEGVVADPAVICGDLVNRVNNAAIDADIALASPCATDTDCTTVTPTWSCAEFGHDVTGCPIVVATGQSIEADVNASALLAESCIDHPFDCVIEAECDDVVARCVEGQCTAG